MIFTSPIWLLALLPWAVAAAVLLWGRRRQVEVPFVELWRDEVAPMRRRSTRLPPVYVILVLLAAMLAIVAAAGPALWSRDAAGRICVILDRGITMSAQPSRMNEVIDQARKITAQTSIVQLIPVPDGTPIETTAADWPALARSLPPTALPTRDLLQAAVGHRLTSDDRLIVVLSDQVLSIDHSRVVQFAPSRVLQNVGFVHMAAGNGQIMATIRNQSSQTSATLSINDEPAHSLELPPRDEQRDYFFPLHLSDEPIHLKLTVDDDLSADNEAWLVRQPAWAKIQARMPLPPGLTRMIDVYAEHRPAGEDNRAIIVPEIADLGDSPGVVFDVAAPAIEGPITVASYAITANVNFGQAISAIPPTMTQGWTPLVYDGRRVFVSVREQPARQVRVSFDMTEFAREADFVVFWTNVFDFFAKDEGEFTAGAVRQLGSEWQPLRDTPGQLWPGIYRRSDGALRAMNALDVRVDPPVEPKPNELPRALASIGARELSAWTLLAAMLCLLAAACVWPRRRRTLFTPGHARI